MNLYLKKYLSAVTAVTLLLTVTGCSGRQPPADEVKSLSEPISASVTELPVEDASSAADAPETVSESDPTQENVQTPEKKRVDTEFEIDTVKFKLALPEGWMAKGNEIYADDVKIAELLPFVPNGDGKAFEALDAQYADAVSVKDVTAGAHSGKYYHMQSEKEVGGVTAKQNELMYYFEIKESYLEIGNSLLHFAFYPVHGTGIGTQRETFEAMLNTIGFHP